MAGLYSEYFKKCDERLQRKVQDSPGVLAWGFGFRSVAPDCGAGLFIYRAKIGVVPDLGPPRYQLTYH